MQPFQQKLELESVRYMRRYYRLNEHISIQASESHYCQPRENLPATEYTHMEVMWLTPKLAKLLSDSWDEYRDGKVFTNVPVELIQEALDKLKSEKGK